MILNMLSTGAMIRIGKAYHNYMIDVRMLNQKLVDRGRRFVSEITGCPYDEAAVWLEAAGQKVKTACVMAAMNCLHAEAERLLAQNDGSLRKVIQQGKENV